MLGAVLLLPRVATSAWDGGQHIIAAIPTQADHGQIIDVLASVVKLFALVLPLVGSVLVTQKIVRGMAAKGRAWSQGSTARSSLLLVASAGLIALIVWAWWPSGQYRPVRANQNGTLGGLVTLVSAPAAVARPVATPVAVPARAQLAAGRHLAISMIPVGGATKRHPALFFISGGKGKPPVAILSPSSPNPSHATGGTFTGGPAGSTTPTSTATTTPAPGTSSSAPGGSSSTGTVPATAFPFKLPAGPGPGDSQAVAVGTKDGGVTYDVAYSLVTVDKGAPVTNRNSAYALASCNRCTTVAVSFQVVLIVGRTKAIAPINSAEALNANCPACTTTAIADQIVVTLGAEPSQALLTTLAADLKQLNALSALGAGGSPAAVASEVAQVQQQIDSQLRQSGLLPKSSTSTTSASQTTTAASSSATNGASSTTTAPAAAQSTSTAAGANSATTPAAGSPTGSASASTTTSSTTGTATSSSSTTAAPAAATTTAPASGG
jgi:putative peptide zinc metalloprotease protein